MATRKIAREAVMEVLGEEGMVLFAELELLDNRLVGS